ncbi:hypothetical protein [Mucilaginibacter psychrotolerans]|uniref:Uncharacterized protein n=1 Tax=Mucilaginibacter psychrotolerans TaxID=1524096 RepID=A0A4Y8SGY3_9SPHI|nr:hypothetical protein [Mucilaginibacter psychrotolerans]TFF37941.1 hypothetical protein E2R66_10150 [Mucilaginibacter psychrotolerans]
MDISDIIKTIITVAIAVIGWIAAHYFSSKRDKTLKRREIISKHLIDTYKILAYDIVHREYSEETVRKLELPLVELQLFGTKRQIELAKKLAYDIQKGGTIDINDLVNDLRAELRKELELEPIDENIFLLRYKKD